MRAVKRVGQYVKAEVSQLVSGPVDDATFQKRIEACQTCKHLEQAEPIGWCGACGCGHRPRAELSIKARMPAATCPEGKW